MSSENSAIFDTVYLHAANALINIYKRTNGIAIRFYSVISFWGNFPCAASDHTEHALSNSLLVFTISVITNKNLTQIFIRHFSRNNLEFST